MDKLAWLRKANLGLAIFLIVAINAIGSLPRMYVQPAMYKGIHHPVGPEVVSVLASDPSDGKSLRVPVQKLQSSGPYVIDTGQHVRVYLKNSYKDDAINFYPRATLLIIFAAFIIHLCTQLMVRQR